AKSIGDAEAFNVYLHLVEITERESLKMENCHVHIHFSDVILKALWPDNQKYVQVGNDLGERMMNAFDQSFKLGYKRVIGIGSDLPDLRTDVMTKGLTALESSDTVFGPSEDGGYYLIGMNQMIPEIFIGKAWSTDSLLNETQRELKELGYSGELLVELNDVDTIEDLRDSSIAEKFPHLFS
ncbi:MAG: glycosyltransferase, partial [Crocinitomicaceae bacterium]|nr:glycosyltransferase [Crocinitomicaceae bacterium]